MNATWEDGWAEYGYDNASYEEKLMFKMGWLAATEAMVEDKPQGSRKASSNE